MKIKTQSGGKNNIDWGSVFTTNKEQIQIELPHSEPINYWKDVATIEPKADLPRPADERRPRCPGQNHVVELRTFLEFDRAGFDQIPGSARVVRGILVGYGKYLDTNGMISGNPFAKTSEKELRITKHDSEAATKKAKGLYTLEDVAQILLAINRGDVAALNEIIH